MDGWIKIHKKLLDWGWYSDGPTKDLFLHILLLCANTEYNYRGQTLLPGQCTLGRIETSKALGITERQYRTALEHLKTTNEIAIKTTNKYTIITVCKWEDYQTNGKKRPSEGPTKGQTNDQQPTTNKDIIRYKEDIVGILDKEEIEIYKEQLGICWKMIEMGYKIEKTSSSIKELIDWVHELAKEFVGRREDGSINRGVAKKYINMRSEYIGGLSKKPSNYKNSVRTSFNMYSTPKGK